MINSLIKPGIFKHTTCRNNIYPKSKVSRFNVPDDLIFWTQSFPDYKPETYTDPHINGQCWADSNFDDENFKPIWNSLDGKINRLSHNGQYTIDSCGLPVNMFGRTGLKGRGLLGRWGPNHAADPVVTRWKRETNGDKIMLNNKYVLQMVAIQRHDNKMWAIPGGMVDAGESVSVTLKREFIEEAMNSGSDKLKIVDGFFQKGKEIYRGYVDDYRNTDNAWIETVVYNFHDDTGDNVGSFKLTAGDDAMNVKWIDINRDIKLHANHIQFIEAVTSSLNSYW